MRRYRLNWLNGCIVFFAASFSLSLAAFSEAGITDGGITNGIKSPVTCDFDSDGKADLAAIVSPGNWDIWLSGDQYQRGGPCTFCQPDKTLVAADFDGDNLADPAVVDSSGNWYVWLSSNNYQRNGPFTLGQAGGTPVAGDIDGDRKADPAMVNGNGAWHIMVSGSGYTRVDFGFPIRNGIPLLVDFDGDGRADPTMYMRATSDWTTLFSGSDYTPTTFNGLPGGPEYMPVPGDYDGDKKADPAIINVNTGEWRLLISGSGYMRVTAMLPFYGSTPSLGTISTAGRPTTGVKYHAAELGTGHLSDVYVYKLPAIEINGTNVTPLMYTSSMSIDADGMGDDGIGGKDLDPQYGQDDTALHYAVSRMPLDARCVRYMVLPEGFNSQGDHPPVRLGDVVAVLYKGRLAYAIYGDVGAAQDGLEYQLGEGSMALASDLGIPNDPAQGGVPEGVVYILFPGSGPKPSDVLSSNAMNRIGRALFMAAGGNPG